MAERLPLVTIGGVTQQIPAADHVGPVRGLSPFVMEYDFDITTGDADPGAGNVRINAAIASTSEIYIDDTAADNFDGEAAFTLLQSVPGRVKGFIRLEDLVTETGAVYQINSAVDVTGYWRLGVTHVETKGTGFNDNDRMVVSIDIAGGQGSFGGGVSIEYTFSTTTTDSDPGDGVLRLDNATQSSATALRLDDVDVNGTNWRSLILTLANTLTDQTGVLRLVHRDDPANYLVFNLTQVNQPTGYSNVFGTVAISSATNPFSNGDPVIVHYTRNGIDGEDGIDGSDANVTPGTTDNAVVRADGTANNAIQGSTATIADTGALTINQASSLETSGAHDSLLISRDSTAAESFTVTAYTAASNNVAIGLLAGELVTTATDNVLLGNQAGEALTEGVDNVCLGFRSGESLTSGDRNMCVGRGSGRDLSTGVDNAFIGQGAGLLAGASNRNTCIGSASGQSMTGGDENTFVGNLSGNSITTGDNNTFVGESSGNNASQSATGGQNVCVGRNTYSASSGATVVGHNSIGNGTNAVAIGQAVTAAANQVVIGNTSITATQLRGDVSIEDTHDLVFSASTGSAIASAATEKIAFWGATPIVQPAGANQAALTNSSGGTANGTISAVSGSGDDATINDNFTELHTLLDEIRTALVNSGLIKGSA